MEDYKDMTGKVYTDPTGIFPITSQSGHIYCFVLYDYDSNTILAEPIKNRTDEEIVHAYSMTSSTII